MESHKLNTHLWLVLCGLGTALRFEALCDMVAHIRITAWGWRLHSLGPILQQCENKGRQCGRNGGPVENAPTTLVQKLDSGKRAHLHLTEKREQPSNTPYQERSGDGEGCSRCSATGHPQHDA